MADDAFRRYSDFLLELYQHSSRLEPDRFQRWALAELKNLVPYDFAAWGGGEQESRQVTDVIVLEQDQRLLTTWSEVGHLDPFCDITMSNLDQTFRFDDVADYRQSLAYNDHWRRFSVRHMMSTIMAEPVDGYITFIGLCSADGDRPFTAAQRELKQLLMPHLSHALRMNRETLLSREAHAGDGTAVVNRAGWILDTDEGFFRLAREEWGQGQRIPASLFHGRSTTGTWRGERVQASYRRFHHHYLVRLRLLSAIDVLTPREIMVAEQFALGLTHKEVARGLDISPATVRNHLARIYDKLGIGSKAELVELLRRHS